MTPEQLASVQRNVPSVIRASEHPQIDPRLHSPNPNPPIGTVGPNVPAGHGDTEVMHAEAWAGWPNGWATPWYEPSSTDERVRGWSGFGYGRHDPDGYLGRVSTVMTCVDLNSSQLASFPVYGVNGLRTVPLPSWSSNPQPEVYADWSDFMMAVANSLQLSGDAVIWATARYADGFPSRFVALDPNHLDIEPDGYGGARYTLAGDELDPADVCHIRHEVLPGRVNGVSPLEWTGRHLASLDALSGYAADIARHGVWAVLKHPNNLNAHQTRDLKANWMNARRQSQAAPAVLSGGVEFDTVSLSPADMALLDIRTMDEQRICAAFRVPPYLVGVDQPGAMTYANASTLTDHHWRVGLRPFAKKIATAMSAWALPHGTRLEFDRDEYIRPGPADRAGYYQTLASIDDGTGPAITVDEIRVAERLEPRAVPATRRPSINADSGDVLIGSNP